MHDRQKPVYAGIAVFGWVCYSFAFSLLLLAFPQLAVDPVALAYKLTVPGTLVVVFTAIPVALAYDLLTFKHK